MNQKIYTILLIVLSIIILYILVNTINIKNRIKNKEEYFEVWNDPVNDAKDYACKNFNFC
jgi:hypothetical protein